MALTAWVIAPPGTPAQSVSCAPRLITTWARAATASSAQRWVRVYEQSDKVLQLQKLRHLAFIIRRFYIKKVAAAKATEGGAARPLSARRRDEALAAAGSGTAAGSAAGSGGGGWQCAGLQELLDGCGLGGSYAAALAWCEKQGYDSVAEIVETGEQGVLVEALQLKPGKAKLLLGRIQ